MVCFENHNVMIAGRNPNAPPSEWWGGEKQWPQVAKPVVGALLEMSHITPSHVAKEAVLSLHDSNRFLEIKHFTNRNSGALGKIKKRWAVRIMKSFQC